MDLPGCRMVVLALNLFELPMPSSKRIFVLVAAYNEALRLGETLRSLTEGQPYPVVVVDDGSTDSTPTIASGFERVVVLQHARNLGQGAALQTGIDYVLNQGAQLVVTFDADGQHSPADIAMLIEPILKEQADIVLGSRFLVRNPQIPLGRWLLLKCGIAFTRFTLGLRITDTHNGLRALSRTAASRIRITQRRMAHASEILHQVRRLKLRYVEVPVSVQYSVETLKKGQSFWGAATILKDLATGPRPPAKDPA